ncbi:MAG: ABC transporter ATP-binding protein [Acidimicrobiales bacterium]
MTGKAPLEIRGVSKNYGGLRAVQDVSFAARGGEILGIVGPNGAGKTTLFDVISGHTRCTRGDVLVDGAVVTNAAVNVRLKRGIARTFQQPTVAGSMTVFENMLLAAFFAPRRGREAGRSPAGTAAEHLELVGLEDAAGANAGSLSIFDKKRLMLATALATGAHVLLLDEPFGGLSAGEIDFTIEVVRRVRDRGVAVVCIEHVMRALVSLADRVMVMHHGATFFEGSPAEMLRDEKVIEIYLGVGAGSRP